MREGRGTTRLDRKRAKYQGTSKKEMEPKEATGVGWTWTRIEWGDGGGRNPKSGIEQWDPGS